MNKLVTGGALLLAMGMAVTLLMQPQPSVPAIHAHEVAALAAPHLSAISVPAGALPVQHEPSLAEQVDALVATRDPAKTYAAYRMLRDCAAFNRDGDRVTFDEEEFKHLRADTVPGFRGMTDVEKRRDSTFCASMTERMRQSRIDYLAFAAQGSVPGAIIEQIEQGPFGDRTALATRPGDPLVVEWKARVQGQLERAAEQDADPGILNYLAVMHMNGSEVVEQDPALSYRYGVAYGMILADIHAPSRVTDPYGPDGGMVRGAADQLTAQERTIQLTEARRIADLARLHREQDAAGKR